jgi:hypothetical protein
MRWGFVMSREHRIVKYKPGMYWDGQSKVMLNGKVQEQTNLNIQCYHACPLKASINPMAYIRKYTGYSMRGKNTTVPTLEDVKWAVNVLFDEGYLIPDEIIELEMKKRPAYGIFMAKELKIKYPDELQTHPRFKEEVVDYWTKLGDDLSWLNRVAV